jgi:hypothetical protein
MTGLLDVIPLARAAQCQPEQREGPAFGFDPPAKGAFALAASTGQRQIRMGMMM